MGLDLTLLPVDYEREGWGYAHTALALDRDLDLLDRIRTLPSTPVPASFDTYRGWRESDEYGYGNTQHDGYGAPLRCVEAGALVPLSSTVPHPAAPTTTSEANRAAWCYLAALEPHTRVALYWH
jgi:hypothetical protein